MPRAMGATWKDPGFASRGVPQLAMMIAEEVKIFCILLAILTCVQVCINVCLYVQLDKFRVWCVCVFVLEWNSWTGGPCQSSCGSGLKTFSRTCQDVANNVVADNSNCELLSPDKSFETRECEENLPACPGVTKWRSQLYNVIYILFYSMDLLGNWALRFCLRNGGQNKNKKMPRCGQWDGHHRLPGRHLPSYPLLWLGLTF